MCGNVREYRKHGEVVIVYLCLFEFQPVVYFVYIAANGCSDSDRCLS